MKMLCQVCKTQEHNYQCTTRCGEVICEECYTEKYIAPFDTNEQMFEFDHSEE